MAAPDLILTETTVPATTGKENRYLSHVDTLNADRTKAITFTVPVAAGADAETVKKAVESVLRIWQDAGRERGVTVRSKVDGASVTVWVRDKITRPRKTEQTAVSAADATPAAS